MEYVALIFGIFGLLAYGEMSSLKNRISDLENQMAKLKGTRQHEERVSLRQYVKSYIGKNVELELKEDDLDADIMMYGNSKHGSNTILDADEDWILLKIETPKGEKEKLIRISSIERISVITE